MASRAARRFLVCAVLSTGVSHFLSVLLSVFSDGTRGLSSCSNIVLDVLLILCQADTEVKQSPC